MPTDLFRVRGEWSTCPQDGGLLASGAAPIGPTPINDAVVLSFKNLADYQLTADPAVAVDFGGVTEANVVIVTADQPIEVTLTSADGTAQVIPVDPRLELISRTVGYTAVSLTRTPGTLTNVSVFVGEMA